MSDAVLHTTTGDVEVLGGELSMPREWNWTGHLELGENAAPTGAVVLELARQGAAPVLFKGTVAWGDTWQGRQKIVIRGGAGGLDTPLPFREYLAGKVPVQAQQLVADVVKLAGEQLAAGALDSLAGLGARRWSRAEGTEASRALTTICSYFGRTWRVLDDGTIWVGVETWPAVPDTLAAFLEDRDGDAITDHAAPDVALLRPGVTAFGKHVERVTYTISGDGAPRVVLLYRSDVDDFGRAVRRVATTDPYALSYAAMVRAQNADGTLELEVDSADFPELRSVPYRSTNGTAEGFGGGESVIVAFLGGREDGAYAWGAMRDPAATNALALVGDGVNAGQLTVAGTGVTLQWTPPGGSPGPAGPSVTLDGLSIAGPGHKRVKGVRGP